MTDEGLPAPEDRLGRKSRYALIGVGVTLIVFGSLGTIIAILPQIETLLLALAGRGYGYLAFGIVGGILLYIGRRKSPGEGPASTGAK